MIRISKNTLVLLTILMAVNFNCAQSTSASSSEGPLPPKGYRSDATMKIAYATGALKLIEKEPAVPESVIAYRDLVYKETDEKTLKLDIYHLKSIKEATPLLVFIHGGSWKGGNKDDYRKYLVDYAKKGYVTATISYRFSQEAPFPAAFDDVVCAIKWLKSHAAEYQIDPEKIAVIGGSAGAHLAMMIGYHANDTTYTAECKMEANAQVQAIVNLYGPVDLTTDFAINHPSVTNFLGATYSEETKKIYQGSSPLFYVSPDDPPTLSFHGTIDETVPVAQADALDQSLKQQGVPSYYHRLEGWPHTMDLGLEVNKYCQHYMDEFFNKYLK